MVFSNNAISNVSKILLKTYSFLIQQVKESKFEKIF